MASELRNEIQSAINKATAENGSDTPDFILAGYLIDCLAAFDRAITHRSRWYRSREHYEAGSPVEAGDEQG